MKPCSNIYSGKKILYLFLFMNDSTKEYNYFLLCLTNRKKSHNAFELLSDSSNSLPYSDFNPFGFSEDLYPFEIKCPICFARATLASRPNKCYHIFCKPCLKKWYNESKKCPCCRKEFDSILDVSYSEDWVLNKYDCSK